MVAVDGAGNAGAAPADDFAAVHLFGFDFAAVTVDQAVAAILALATGAEASLVVTANVDHIVELARNQRFVKAYESAALRLADGAPVVLASRLLRTPLLTRAAGSDLVDPLCSRAAEKHTDLAMAIVGGQPDVNQLAVEHVQRRHPTLSVVGINTPQGFDTNTAWSSQLLDDIRRAAAPIVLFCCGAPRSELWVAEHRHELPAGVYVCAGAAVDFLAGTKRRAPMLLRRLGLEWVYRLVLEPRRLWRRYLVKDPAFALLLYKELRRARRQRRAVATAPVESQLGMRVGIDMVSVDDVASSIEGFGQRYLDSLFTPTEQELCGREGEARARSFAGRFAAKEAVLKSLRPMPDDAVPWTSIEIARSADGSCFVNLGGQADQLRARNHVASVTVSISHDHQYATAVAIATTEEPRQCLTT